MNWKNYGEEKERNEKNIALSFVGVCSRGAFVA